MSSPLIQCFPPVVDKNAATLILGSMPGMASLTASQYYAHPRNTFWPIMSQLLGFLPEAAYAERLRALQTAGIALWDVLQACERKGSLDASIVIATQIANDFPCFLRLYPHIQHIFFNGGSAHAAFMRHVPGNCLPPHIRCTRLPSTSPANAGITFIQKLAAWRIILDTIHPAGQHSV
ncbi:MAG: DNA-deoxyinosine glycosylase [Nitrosomonas sp.]|nr:DNA-deoxyinosine glycosylase [Nitrosomonas sp.]